jgi:hypothetical protein
MTDLKTSVQFLTRVIISFICFHLSLLKTFLLQSVRNLILPDHAHVREPHHVVEQVVEETAQPCEEPQDLHDYAMLVSLACEEISYVLDLVNELEELEDLSAA